MRLATAIYTIFCLSVGSIAYATLTVEADSVELLADGSFSQTLALSSPDAHAVTGGRLILSVQPIDDATGTVQFDTSLPGFPNGAITNATQKFSITSALPGNPGYSEGNTVANVFWTPTSPGQIPVAASDAAFNINYAASSDASGTFGLYLLYETATAIGLTSHWRGQGTEPGTSTLGAPFDLPFEFGKTLIGTIGPKADPIRTDFNGDGLVDVADLEAISAAVFAGTDEAFDINGDGAINAGDLDQWLASGAEANGFRTPYAPGDLNLDRVVGAADLNTMALRWQSELGGYHVGDLDNSGFIDAGDLNILGLNWGSTAPRLAPVPEPANQMYILSAAVLLLLRRRR